MATSTRIRGHPPHRAGSGAGRLQHQGLLLLVAAGGILVYITWTLQTASSVISAADFPLQDLAPIEHTPTRPSWTTATAVSVSSQDEPKTTPSRPRIVVQNATTVTSIEHLLSDIPTGLPHWITNYMTWHRQQRSLYPDDALITDESAPGLLIQYCKGERRNICGGLHDRLGGLATSLYLANQTNRVLLIQWFVPRPLQDFLMPTAALNWTLPFHDRFRPGVFLKQNRRKPPIKARHLSFVEWAALNETRSKKVVVLFREGHSVDLSSKLIALGETDTIHDTATFGKVWHAMFRPSALVQSQLNQTRNELGLIPGQYLAAHCRVRHPGRFATNVAGKTDHEADSTGLPWMSPHKEMAVESALHALKCSEWVANATTQPIYFYSDSEDLVHYLLDAKNRSSIDLVPTSNANETGIDLRTRQLMQKTRFTARNLEWPTVHLDRQLGLPAEAYVSTFVDLYMAAGARCIAFGVGNFGFFASKLSGTKCLVVHEKHNSRRQAQLWRQQTGGAPTCPLELS